MALQPLVPNVYTVSLGAVNAFILDDREGVIVIDTGLPGSGAAKILDGVHELGKQPTDVRHILVTHLHADHIGGLAALKRETGAPAYMHPTDAALVRKGIAARYPIIPAPGFVPRLMATLMPILPLPKPEPADIEHEIKDGDVLPLAGGVDVIHVPGHSAGQVAFLWRQQGGVLFAGDAAANRNDKLTAGVIFEDFDLARQSARKLSTLQFEAACFGHGKGIVGNACQRFVQAFA